MGHEEHLDGLVDSRNGGIAKGEDELQALLDFRFPGLFEVVGKSVHEGDRVGVKAAAAKLLGGFEVLPGITGQVVYERPKLRLLG